MIRIIKPTRNSIEMLKSLCQYINISICQYINELVLKIVVRDATGMFRNRSRFTKKRVLSLANGEKDIFARGIVLVNS